MGNFWQLTNQSKDSQYVAVGGSYSSGGPTNCTNGTQNVTFIGGGASTAATGTIAVSGGIPTGAITMKGNGAGYTSAPTQVQVANCTGQTTITGAENQWHGRGHLSDFLLGRNQASLGSAADSRYTGRQSKRWNRRLGTGGGQLLGIRRCSFPEQHPILQSRHK